MYFRLSWGLALLQLLLIMSPSSCSIKEGRKQCPCLLTVSFENMPPGSVNYCIKSMHGDILAEGESAHDWVLSFHVPRSGVVFYASSGVSLHTDGISIPYGSDCPKAYLFSKTIDTDCDAIHLPVRVNKHFCILNLVIDGPPGNGPPPEIRVRGEVDGLDFEGVPHHGSFFTRINCSCILPRQAFSDRLLLEIVMEDELVKTFALGNYIREAGYDWNADDLKDLNLQLSLSVSSLHLDSEDWSVSTSLNVEI